MIRGSRPPYDPNVVKCRSLMGSRPLKLSELAKVGGEGRGDAEAPERDEALVY